MKKHLHLTIFFAIIYCLQNVRAQSVGDYKSIASGNWHDITTWQMYDGATWIPAVLPPTPISGKITINDSVIVNGTDSADEVTVASTGVLNILTSKSLKLLNGPGTDLQCNGRLIVGVGGQLAANDTSVSTMNYTSPKELDIDGAVNPVTTFNGAATQSIQGVSGSGYFGRQITVDNTLGLTVNGIVGFAGVNFINGKIWVPGSFIIGQYSGNNFIGQGPGKFIDGNIDCIVFDETPATFELPTGIGNDFLPATFHITLSENKESGFVLSITNAPAPDHNLPIGIDKVSSVRYYTITNPNNVGIATASLQLSYNSNDGATDPTNLRIVKSDDAATNNWINIGGTGTDVNNGTITSTVNFTSLSIFALANATGGSNTLPLKITDFSATQLKQSIQLNWSTTNEINTGYFAIDRKENNGSWQTITSVPAKQQATLNKYIYTDVAVKNNSTYYYQLKEIDKDGSTYTSKIVQTHLGAISKMSISLMYPNPAHDVLRYTVASPADDAVSITVFNNNAKAVASLKTITNQSLQLYVKNLPAGTYYFSVINSATGEKIMKKFIKL